MIIPYQEEQRLQFSRESQVRQETELKLSPQTFYALRIHTPQQINIAEQVSSWHSRYGYDSRNVEQIDEKTWKIWETTKVVDANEEGIILEQIGINGERQPLRRMTIENTSYIRGEQNKKGTDLTIVSENEDATFSTESFFRNIYYPTRRAGLDIVRKRNQGASLQAIHLYNVQTGDERDIYLGRRLKLGTSAKIYPGLRVLDYTIEADVDESPLKMTTLSVDKLSQSIVFSADSSTLFTPSTEAAIINSAFALTDKVYRGERVIAPRGEIFNPSNK